MEKSKRGRPALPARERKSVRVVIYFTPAEVKASGGKAKMVATMKNFVAGRTTGQK